MHQLHSLEVYYKLLYSRNRPGIVFLISEIFNAASIFMEYLNEYLNRITPLLIRTKQMKFYKYKLSNAPMDYFGGNVTSTLLSGTVKNAWIPFM